MLLSELAARLSFLLSARAGVHLNCLWCTMDSPEQDIDCSNKKQLLRNLTSLLWKGGKLCDVNCSDSRAKQILIYKFVTAP